MITKQLRLLHSKETIMGDQIPQTRNSVNLNEGRDAGTTNTDNSSSYDSSVSTNRDTTSKEVKAPLNGSQGT